MRASLIMPAYNATAHIQRALDSVLAETVAVDEIIVVDDGSTDGTAELVRRYHPRVRCLTHRVNRGLPTARNSGIGEARNEWLTFLDADDEWLPHIVEAQVRLLERNPQLKWFYHNVCLVYRGVVTAGHVPPDLEEEARRTGMLDFFAAQLRRVPFGVGGFFIHRAVFEELGGFDPTLRRAQDRDMWWRIAMRHPAIGYTPDPGFRYHKDTPGSLTKGAPTRDLQLSNICQNMRRAQALGPEVASRARPLFRRLFVEYALRNAAGTVKVSPELLAEAGALFPLALRDRVLAVILRTLPRPLARSLERALSGRSRDRDRRGVRGS
jgi:glycosyltransferase involved in cell wall biosynthesis